MNNNHHIVLLALRTTISDPVHFPEYTARWFAADYQQQVDGKILDYSQFIAHMAALKTLTCQMSIDIKAVVASDDTVLTHHLIRVIKQDGQTSLIEVLTHFQCRAGKIVRCDELTRLLIGDPADADLGKRLS